MSGEFVDPQGRASQALPSAGPLPHRVDGEWYRLLVERTADYSIILLDAGGHIATWNAGARRIHGGEAQDVLGQHVSVLYPAETGEGQEPARRLELAARDGHAEGECWRVRRDGTLYRAHVVITALSGEHGRLAGFGEISRELSRSPKAGHGLHESEERLRLLIESTTDYAIFMLDPGGCIITWNPGAERMKGYTADEIIGRHFSTFYPSESVASGWPDTELREASRVGRFEDEGWRLRKDGSRFWANVVITALRDGDGSLRGFAKVTRDMSQRKAHEERIQKLARELQTRVDELAATNHELAQKSAENESFVYSVSHDLRAPLVNLQGFSHELTLTSDTLESLLSQPAIPEDIRRQGLSLLRGELQESIGFIRNAVRHLGAIIDGLLRLSRVGRVEYESAPVDVEQVARGIVAAMHTTIVNAGARVEIGSLPTVSGDANAIGQVFANLIDNAVKSLESDRAGRIEIAAMAGDPPVFVIRDNGVGIPAEYRPKMFQVFQQVHKLPSRGEGLGLAIVRRIVERHGGRIWFESERGAGTAFFFTLSGPQRRETRAKEEGR